MSADSDASAREREEQTVIDAILKEAFALEPATAPRSTWPQSVLGLPARYQPLGECARGGMGIVYRAHDLLLQREVAIKFLNERQRDRPASAQRFLEEAQVLSQLQHPHIVPVHDIGVTAENGPFMAMKLVEGQTLADLLAARESAQQEQHHHLGVLVQVCQAIGYAHAHGVIHRDLKPGNVMVGRFGEVQVMDFGMAKILHRTEPRSEVSVPSPPPQVRSVRTQDPSSDSVEGSVMGTYAYMPPEQARGTIAQIDQRSDVWSLGAMLCEILTGAPPYPGNDSARARKQAAAAELGEAHCRLDGAEVEPALRDLCKSCLDPEPGRRPRDAGVLAQGLTDFLAAQQQRAHDSRVQVARVEERGRAERRAWRTQRNLLLAILGTLTLAAGAWAYAEIARRHRAVTTAKGVDETIAEARSLLHRAREPGADEQTTLVGAASAAQRAVVLARQPDADESTRLRAAAVLADVERLDHAAILRREHAKRDSATRARLQEIGEGVIASFEHQRAATQYEAAFQNHGLDVLGSSSGEVAGYIRASAIREDLIAAVDDWSTAALNAGDQLRAERLRLVAQEADTDPIRQRIRAARDRREELELLRAIAAEPTIAAVPPRTVRMLGLRLERAGDPERGRRVLRDGLVRHPNDFWLNFFYAWSFRSRNEDRSDEARYFHAALVASPESILAMTNLAVALWGLGKKEDSLALLDQVIALHPTAALPHANRAGMLVETGKSEAALRSAREALRLEPDSSYNLLQLGRALTIHGDHEEADLVLSDARSRWPDDPGLLLAHGVLLCDKLRRPQEAAALFSRLTVLEPTSRYAQFNLGVAQTNLGEPRAAIRSFHKALEIDPRSAPTHARLGNLLATRGLHDKAAHHLRTALEIDPTRAETHWKLGRELWELGQRKEAIACYQTACRLAPGLAEAWHDLGHDLLEEGRVGAALEAIRKAIETGHPPVQSYGVLGWAQLRNGLPVEAVATFRKATELRPEDASVLVGLGLALMESGDLRSALFASERAAALLPDGSANARIEVIKKMIAYENVTPGLEVDPSAETDASRVIALAGLCTILKRHAHAARLWVRAIELDPPALGLPGGGPRIRAAREAIQAAEEPAVGMPERATLRFLARAQLTAVLDACFEQPDIETPSVVEQGEALARLRADPRLQAVVDKEQVKSLPVEEASAWKVLWQRVQALSRPR